MMTMIKNELPLNSRVWVYQAARILSQTEAKELLEELDMFVSTWEAHSVKLKAKGEVFYDQFLVLFVDEKPQQATGCSIDKSVAFVKKMEERFGVRFMDRMMLAFRNENHEIQTLSMMEFQEKVANGEISENTIVFNNLVETKKDLIENWEVPAKESWHKNLFSVVGDR